MPKDSFKAIKADADHYYDVGVSHPARAFKLISRLADLRDQKRKPRKRKGRR